MTLHNLPSIGRLKAHVATALEIKRLLAAIERNLFDARVAEVSDETRFDAAYKAIMQCALTAMMASGYRPSTSEPGHHATLIQTLPLTLGIPADAWVVIDALRRKRNANDYTGELVTGDMVAECCAQGRDLFVVLQRHLARSHPRLVSP